MAGVDRAIQQKVVMWLTVSTLKELLVFKTIVDIQKYTPTLRKSGNPPLPIAVETILLHP